ncbi:MAG: MFS transporter [Caulobacterales bacterium]
MRRSSITTLEKIGYASGNLGKNLVFASLDYFLLFFLTEVWGLAPAQAGLVVLIALVWDGVADPIVGVFLDRVSTPFGRFRPYLLIGAPIAAITFALVFIKPEIGGPSLATWAIVSTLAFRTAYTICDVPHNALLARVAPDATSAAFVSGARFVFSSIGSLMIGVAAMHILATPDVAIRAHRFLEYASFAAAIFVVTLWIAWASTRSVDRGADSMGPRQSIAASLMLSVRNRALRWLLLTAFLQAAAIPVFAKSLAYYGAFGLNDPKWSGMAIVAMTLAQAASAPLWIAVSQRSSASLALVASLATAALGAGLFFLAHGEAVGRIFALIVFGAAVGGLNIAIWALLPAVIAWGEANQGLRAEGLPSGLFLLSLKAGSGIGAAILGVVLQQTGALKSSASSSGFEIALIMGAIPVVGALACIATTSKLARTLHPPTRSQ